MRRPIVIRKVKGAIQTLVIYLRGKSKATAEVSRQATIMAEKKEPTERKGPNKPNEEE